MFDLVSVYGNKEERYWLITEGEGVGMDLRDKASPDSSCPRQGYLPLDQVAQDLIQPGLSTLPGLEHPQSPQTLYTTVPPPSQ